MDLAIGIFLFFTIEIFLRVYKLEHGHFKLLSHTIPHITIPHITRYAFETFALFQNSEPLDVTPVTGVVLYSGFMEVEGSTEGRASTPRRSVGLT